MGRSHGRARCLNCKAPVGDRFCGHCGQRNRPLRIPLWRQVPQILGEAVALDSRVGRTLPPFLFRPGFLTREYNEGKRVRYSSPLRMYLLTSLLLFLGLGITRFAADFALTRQLLAERGDHAAAAERLDWADVPAAPPGVADLGSYASRAVDDVTRTLSDRSIDYEQSISAIVISVLGADHPICRFIVEKMEKLRGMDWAEARLAGFDNWLNLLPTAMFLLLPLCAVALMVCFVGTRRYYAEHLVFVLHLHAFIYLLLLVLSWTWSTPSIALGILVTVVYILVGLRIAYRASILATAIRGPLFLVMYASLLAAGLGGTFWISLMLI